MTHLHLLLHIVTLDIEALVVPWHQFIYSLLVPDGRLAIQPVQDSVLQVLIICMSFTSKVLLHLQEEVEVRWCQVRTVWRMVECVPKLNNCAACMRKRSLLSRCPTYSSRFVGPKIYGAFCVISCTLTARFDHRSWWRRNSAVMVTKHRWIYM